MAYYLHLLEKTLRDGGSTVTDLDLGNSGGSSKFRLVPNGRTPGEQDYRITYSGNSLVAGKRITAFTADVVEETITIQIRGTSINDVLNQKTALERFFLNAMRAQVERSNDRPANFFLLAENPNNLAANTSTTEILTGTVRLPRDWASKKLDNFIVDDVQLRIVHAPWFTASVIEIVTATAIDNGEANFISIPASGVGDIVGDLPSALKIKIDGGTSTIVRLLVAAKVSGTPSLYSFWLWSKDATEVVATADETQTWINGNATGLGELYTAAGTTEVCVWRWTVTANVASQYGIQKLFARAYASVASRYSMRARIGLTDGTNIVYPFGWGYTLEAEELAAVTTRDGSNVPLVELGEMQVPTPATAETIYGFVIELYVTCSNISGAPTLVLDGICRLPIGESADGSGYCDATFDVGIAAAGVDAAFISMIGTEPRAYLANATPLPTIFRPPNGTQGLIAYPQTAMRIYFLGLDANNRNAHADTFTISVWHQLQVTGNVGDE